MSGISLNNTYNTFVSSNTNSSNYILNSSNNLISYANNKDINLSNYILNTSNIISNRFSNTSANVSNINTITNNSEAYLIYNFDDDPYNGILTNKSTFAQQNTSYPLHSTIKNDVVISNGGGSNLGTTDGLVLWYKFDNNFNDSSGNNYHLNNNGATINNTSNIRGNGCAYFSGTNQYCTLPSTINFGATDEMTFCCWFRFDSNGGERLFDLATSSSSSSYTNIPNNIYFARNGNSFLELSVFNGLTQDAIIISTFRYSYFYHIAIVFKKTGTTGLANNTWNVYINGSLVYSSSSRRFPTSIPTGYTNSYFCKSNWTTQSNFSGYIDDFRYYNRELSLNEIKEIYGYSLTRQIGYVNPFNYYWNSYNLYDSAFINIPSEVLYPIIKSKKFSICYWNKLENIINDISILKLQQDNNPYLDIKLETHSTSNITKMIISNGSNLSSNVTTWGETNTNTNINAYNHYVHTFDYTGSTMTMKTYKNGIQKTAIGQLDGTSNNITNFSFNPIKKQQDIKYPRQALTGNSMAYTDGSGITVQVGGSTYYDTDNWNYYKAFDNNKTSSWSSDITPSYTYLSSIPYGTAVNTYKTGYPGEYIEIDLGEAIVLSYYILYPREYNLYGSVGYSHRLPSTFRIYASNNPSAWGTNNINHSSWILIDDRIDYTPTEYNKFYIPNNTVAYRYYVMIINKIGGLKANANSTCVGIGEWELYSSVNNCFIGKQNNATNLVSSYTLEDFRIYDRVLTDNEIKSIGDTSSEMYGMQKINSTINNIIPVQWVPVNTGITYMNGNVGIGTTNPVTTLHINGSNVNQQLIISDSTNTISQLILGTNYNSGTQYSTIQSVQGTGNYKTLAINPNGGNVGIGTTNPSYKFQVEGDININLIVQKSTQSSFGTLDNGNSGCFIGTNRWWQPYPRTYTMLHIIATGYTSANQPIAVYYGRPVINEVGNISSWQTDYNNFSTVDYVWNSSGGSYIRFNHANLSYILYKAIG